jgi:uncharacterized membrane-anchored protein YjiN (DUF445 family)
VPPNAAPATAANQERRSRLRRMKTGATALLVLAAGLYALTFRFHHGGSGLWGYVRTGAEAAMIGGLADWFAVTALFRRPLGLPIPHTALIPERKDAIGRSLQDFVGEYFLTPAVLRDRLADAGVPQRLGRWLADEQHARRLAVEAGSLGAAALRVVRNADLEDALARGLRERLERESFARQLGTFSVPLVAAGGHHAVLDLVLDRLRRSLAESPDVLITLVEELAPGWSPHFVDRAIARRVHASAARIIAEVADDPTHPLRRKLDAQLLHFAQRLCDDEQTQRRVDAAARRLVDHPETGRSLRALLDTGREMLAEQLNREGELRARIAGAIQDAGTRLQHDERWQRAVDRWAADAGDYLITHYRDEVTRVISETVDRWEGRDAARRIELHVGRDLQFIRINGAVVGAVAGLIIHAVTVAAT